MTSSSAIAILPVTAPDPGHHDAGVLLCNWRSTAPPGQQGAPMPDGIGASA